MFRSHAFKGLNVSYSVLVVNDAGISLFVLFRTKYSLYIQIVSKITSKFSKMEICRISVIIITSIFAKTMLFFKNYYCSSKIINFLLSSSGDFAGWCRYRNGATLIVCTKNWDRVW